MREEGFYPFTHIQGQKRKVPTWTLVGSTDRKSKVRLKQGEENEGPDWDDLEGACVEVKV